ncbi:DNA polymerase II [Candidatus Woesearchaeota archaeon]|nr:MAG: DNA polymerase II [Candidatus Woesearchaeota archaeon]
MHGFIVYPTYRIIDNKAFVYLFGRLENGESFLTINECKPYFYIKKLDLEKAKTLAKFETEENHFKNFEGEEVIKIILTVTSDVPITRDLLQSKDIPTYEADIRFIYRFMIDNDIKGSMKITGDYKKGDFVDRIYENPKLSESDFFPELKMLAIDIETDAKQKEIYCISLYTKTHQEVLIHSNKKLNNATSFATEKELLETFIKKIKELDPDVITGWNVIQFDIRVLEEKCKKYNIPFVLGRTRETATLKIFNDFLRESKADIPGRMVLDGIHLIKTSFMQLKDYTLDNAASEILGEKKLIGKKDKGKEIEDAFRNNQQKLVDYNLKDSELVYNILEKTGVVKLTIQRSLLTGLQLDKVNASVASLDNLYLRETRKRKIVCNNSQFSEKEKPITGGFVRDSMPGLYEHIVVLDFKSLYPSVMRTFNIDPYSFVHEKPKQVDKKKFVVAPNGAVFKNEEGILPSLIQELWAQREKARKQKNELARYAIKILMNSFFGVLANPSCRFFSMEISNAITHCSQMVIKLTAEKIKEKGYVVIYGDTDSVFIDTEAKNDKEAENIGKELQDYINNFYQDYIKKEYHRESYLELQLDKVFLHFLMPRIRGSEVGAKKRYAGLIMENEKEKLVFTGLESKRSDWTALSKKFQEELLLKIFKKEKYDAYIRTFIDDLKKGKYDDLLIYRKKINKPLSAYVKTTPPHVKAARKLKEIHSNVIMYMMTTDGPEPIQQIKHQIDYEHYLDKQIKPIADAILTFIDKSFEDVMKNSKQTSLSGF